MTGLTEREDTGGRSRPVGSVVVDFDGTICPQDVSEEILESFAPREWWDIDLRFQRGEIGSRECLVRQGDLLKGRQEEMLAFVLDRYRVEPSFGPFVRWARTGGIDVMVASDGLGFYLEPMLRAAGVPKIEVATNRVAIEEGRPPTFEFPNGNPECIGCGTCKMLVVLERRRRFGRVAFVGEGHTDRYGALYSDVVFAKKHLVDICREDGVPSLPWETFDDVRTGLERLARTGPPVAPALCPGWIPAAGGLPGTGRAGSL